MDSAFVTLTAARLITLLNLNYSRYQKNLVQQLFSICGHHTALKFLWLSSQLKFSGNFLDCSQRDTKIFLYHSSWVYCGLWVSLRSCHPIFIMFSWEGAPNSRQVSARSHEESLKFYFYPLS